jgi:hypothetical protein
MTGMLEPCVFSSFHLGNMRATSTLERRTTYAFVTFTGTLFFYFALIFFFESGSLFNIFYYFAQSRGWINRSALPSRGSSSSESGT